MDNETKEKLLKLIKKEKSIKSVAAALDITETQVLGLVNILKEDGINIVEQKKDDGIYIINQGETRESITSKNFQTNDSNEFRFLLISDTRLGSKYQQLSELNNLYQIADNLGIDTVIHCGNLSAGLYSIKSPYADTNFIDDTQGQIDYIVENYPYIEGITTYFITGKKDNEHLSKKGINIGRRIEQQRDDMKYLGNTSCTVNIDKAQMMLINSKLSKTYTVSYRAQQHIDSFRSEDKPDILLYAGHLQMENLTYRGVHTISVPSLCATTPEMNEKRYMNTVGAFFVTVKTDKYGKFESIKSMWSPYYKTNKKDYEKAKVLKLTKGGQNGR